MTLSLYFLAGIIICLLLMVIAAIIQVEVKGLTNEPPLKSHSNAKEKHYGRNKQGQSSNR